MKLQATYMNINFPSIYKYYSKSGLMERKWIFNDLEVATITNPDGIGTIDRTDETVFTSFHINPE